MIRRAFVFDANELTKMWDSMHREIATRPAMLEEYSNLTNLFISLVARIESPDWCVAVYEKDETIAGFMMSRIRWPQYNQCHVIGECEVIYVKPEFRGDNIHKMLIDESIKWCKANNAKEFEFSGPYDKLMIKFWDALGYEPVIVTYRQKEDI